MKNIAKRLTIISFVTILFSGCGSLIMKQATTVNYAKNENALVTFMMSSKLERVFSRGKPIRPIEYDIWDGDKFMGALSTETYFQVLAEPGEHLYIAEGGNWSFVKASLQAGKRYYLFLNIYPRPWGRFGVYLQPVKIEDKELISELPTYLNNLEPMSVIEEKYNSYTKDRIEKVRNEIEVFQANSDYGFSLLEQQDGR